MWRGGRRKRSGCWCSRHCREQRKSALSVCQWFNGSTGSPAQCLSVTVSAVVGCCSRSKVGLERLALGLSQFPALGKGCAGGGEGRGCESCAKGLAASDVDELKKTVKVIKILLLVTGCAWRGRNRSLFFLFSFFGSGNLPNLERVSLFFLTQLFWASDFLSF